MTSEDESPGSKRILAIAYACDPTAGSEPGAGWVWARLLARLGEVWVVTRANNRPAIASEIDRVPERGSLRFVYVDLPAWSRRWKQGQRGVRLYYMLWQIAALRKARRLHREVDFAIAWHLTLANAWLGSVGALVGPPFVLGPVGGGQRVPWPMFSSLGAYGSVKEIIREIAKAAGKYCNLITRLAWRRATLILVLNPGTASWLPRRYRHKAVVFPNAVLEEYLSVEPVAPTGPNTALFAGRLLSWKGPALAMQAIARTPDWRLSICGLGPEKTRLVRLAKRLRIEDRVDFLGLISRRDLLDLMHRRAHVFLFPSLRDDSPWVVAEALACGLPVVCLSGGGSALLAGSAGLTVSCDRRPDMVVIELAEHLRSISLDHRRASIQRAKQMMLDARVADIADLLAPQKS